MRRSRSFASGIVGGTVRAVVGPVLAAFLWHLAVGVGLRHGRLSAASQSLPALITREVRERLLSRLGLAVRDRSAEQITRDRATLRAVALAAKLAERAQQVGPKTSAGPASRPPTSTSRPGADRTPRPHSSGRAGPLSCV